MKRVKQEVVVAVVMVVVALFTLPTRAGVASLKHRVESEFLSTYFTEFVYVCEFST